MLAPNSVVQPAGDPSEVTVFWPLVVVLGEIAERIERRRTEEYEPPSAGDYDAWRLPPASDPETAV